MPLKLLALQLFLFLHLNDQKIRNCKFQTNNEGSTLTSICNNSGERHNSDTRKASRQAKTIRYKYATRKREKETGGGICFQFPPSGRCILLFMAGRGGVFFSEAGRGGCFFFRGGTGWLFFFYDGTGRGGVFFFFKGRDGTVVFGGGNFFGGTGQNRYTVPPKAV